MYLNTAAQPWLAATSQCLSAIKISRAQGEKCIAKEKEILYGKCLWLEEKRMRKERQSSGTRTDYTGKPALICLFHKTEQCSPFLIYRAVQYRNVGVDGIRHEVSWYLGSGRFIYPIMLRHDTVLDSQRMMSTRSHRDCRGSRQM
jgi:hypothetical protein